MGKKKKPMYKIVAADSRSPRDGKVIENIGFYNPHTDPMQIVAKENRVFYWLKNGAIPTETVRSLLKREGLMLKWNLLKRKKDQEYINEQMNKFFSERQEKLAREKERKLRRKMNKVKKSKEEKAEEAPKTE